MDTLLFILIPILVGGALLGVIYAVSQLKAEVPSEDREYMDPLPPLLRLVWPLVRFLEFHVCAFIPSKALERTHEKLQKTGVGYLIGAEQFLRFACCRCWPVLRWSSTCKPC